MSAQEQRFIGEAISVIFEQAPTFSKSPHAPDAFEWRDETWHISEVESEWRDFRRRGRMARNMRPEHASRASNVGSRGVGRFYFRVHTTVGRVFDLYYDRSAKNADDQLGSWHLYREIETND